MTNNSTSSRFIDNTDIELREVFRNKLRESEEVRVSTGYFRLSGFAPLAADAASLASPSELGCASFRIIMGTETDQPTADEIEAGRSLRERLLDQFAGEIEDMNAAELSDLDRLRDFIASGRVEIRVRDPDEGYFHAKGASFRHPQEEETVSEESEDDDSRPATTIIGTSNFTQRGHVNNVELNLITDSPTDASAFDSWFDSQWAMGTPASEDILKIIEESDRYSEWKAQQEAEEEPSETEGVELGAYIEPFEMYKVLAYDALNGFIAARESPLFHFQRVGYESAREKLGKYNGCVISDSVGLGKSYIGAELLRDYRQQNDRCLLIVPANIEDQWRTLLEEEADDDGEPLFGLAVDGDHVRIMSITKFQNQPYHEARALADEFDVVLIDESHRFRTRGQWRGHPPAHDDDYRGTRRHANLRLLRGLTMIMLTATPVNNSAKDLKNLLSLFTDKNEIRNKAQRDFGAFDEYIKLSERRKSVVSGNAELDADESLQGITDRLSDLSEEISAILNEVMVLRTRSHIQQQITDEEAEEYEFDFSPPSVTPEEYDLPPVYRPVYDDLPTVMDALHLPHITVKNPDAGATLKALYKLNLLKRLESSTYAFLQSIQTVYQSERQLLALLNQMPEDTPAGALADPATLADVGIEIDDIDEEVVTTLDEFGVDADEVAAQATAAADGGNIELDKDALGGDHEFVDATVTDIKAYVREDLALLSVFLKEFVPDIAADRDMGNTVADEWANLRAWLRERNADRLPVGDSEDSGGFDGRVYPGSDLNGIEDEARAFYDAVFRLQTFRDPKIDQIVDLLDDRAGQKVLIFTQYQATAQYLHRTLVDERTGSPLDGHNSAVVTGESGNKRDVIRRLSPDANNYRESIEEGTATELTYVVATDTLSEGVNAQDVDVVVNFDLPWNPMRIVQRVGRIDRIGSAADKHVHNFFPDGDIEAAISLLERLQAKISDIALIVGKENNILDPEENEVLEEAGVETEKTIGEIEVEKVEGSLRETREARDVTAYDDTGRNPLLREAGSDERAAFERLLLRRELTDDDDGYGLDDTDFEFATDYFDQNPGERDPLHTQVANADCGLDPGAFGLAHAWFEYGDEEPPLGRTDRNVYHTGFGENGRVEAIQHLRRVGIEPDASDVSENSITDAARTACLAINDHVDNRLEAIRNAAREGGIELGGAYSKEQETVLRALEELQRQNAGMFDLDGADPAQVGDRAATLEEQFEALGLANTDEDRILRERFREEERALVDWPASKVLDQVESFLDNHVAESPEYQTELVEASEVQGRVLCWGIVTR